MKNLLTILTFALIFFPNYLISTMIVKYLKTPEDAIRYQYQYDLIDMVLEKTKPSFGPYEIKTFDKNMSSRRINQEAVRGEKINLHWSDVGHPQLDNGMFPIPIPILKGIHGHRIFLIQKKHQHKFSKIKSLEDLKKLSLGQGDNWGDIKIYEHNKMKVIKGSSYSGLFGMLVKERFDYFPRSVLEAPVEYEAMKEKYPNLQVEESILLFYPFPVFFYVSKNSPELAFRMLIGLEIMIEDGSLDKLFFKFHKDIIEKAKLEERKIFKIENPFLPNTVPYHRKKLWLDITKMKEN